MKNKIFFRAAMACLIGILSTLSPARLVWDDGNAGNMHALSGERFLQTDDGSDTTLSLAVIPEPGTLLLLVLGLLPMLWRRRRA